jgi:hypothetical protein
MRSLTSAFSTLRRCRQAFLARWCWPRPSGCFAELPLLSEDTLRQLRIAGLSDSEVQDLIEKCAAVAAAELKEE